MAVVTARAIVFNTTAGNKTTGSFTPAAGDLLVAIVGIATLDTAPTMSDSQSGAWTLVDTFRSQATTGGLRMYVRNTSAPNTSMTVTMTSTGDAGGGLAVLSVTDVSVFGAGAVRSSGGQADVASATPAPVLNQTPRSTNAIITAVMDNTNGSANGSPRTSPVYTEHYDQGFTTPPTGIAVHSVNSGETSATITYGGSTPSTFASIAIEINSPVPKSGITESPRSASGGDATTYAETGTCTAAFTGSGAKQLTVQRSGSAVSSFVGDGSEILTATKLGAGVSARVASGTASKSTTYPKQAIAVSPYTVSGASESINSESGTAVSARVGDASYVLQTDLSGTAVLTATASGIFVHVIERAGSAEMGLEAVAPEVMERAKVGTVEVDFTASGEQERFQQKEGAAVMTLNGVGERGETVYNRESAGVMVGSARGRSGQRPLTDQISSSGTSLGSQGVAETE